MQQTFPNALKAVLKYAQDIGLTVVFNADGLDPFFKGDLDGQTIWLDHTMDDEDSLFNVLHLIGHCIQWNINQDLYILGSQLHSNPDEKLIARLYAYEWEANCYANYILQYLGFKSLRSWLYDMFKEDINYLIRYYRTGIKEKVLPEERIPAVELHAKAIPEFTPVGRKKSRGGIVI